MIESVKHKKIDSHIARAIFTEFPELRFIKKPEDIQGYISGISQNFEKNGDSCMSVVEVLRKKEAHCIEGALVAAFLLWAQGEPPLLLDLMANNHDDDHVVALFRKNGYWGAISKGNHVYLRYRDPIYKNIRELALSYFHEYYNSQGKKTLRSYSVPLSLDKKDPFVWVNGKDAWAIAEELCDIPHQLLFPKSQEKFLRNIDDIQHRSAKLVEYSE